MGQRLDKGSFATSQSSQGQVKTRGFFGRAAFRLHRGGERTDDFTSSCLEVLGPLNTLDGFQKILLQVLDQAPALISVTTGSDHVIQAANRRYLEMIGDRPVLGVPARQAFPDLTPDQFAILDTVYATGRGESGSEIAVRLSTPAGPQTRYFNYSLEPLRNEAGEVYGLISHSVDITEQVQARQALEERTAELERASERLRLAAEAGRLGAWEWEVGTGRVIWSPELERLHGLEPGTFGGTFEDYQSDMHPDDRERVLVTIADNVRERKPHLLEYRIVLPDGSVRWLEARGRMILGPDGELERLLGICMDVTTRKEQEQEARRWTEELARRERELERTNRELDAFAYAASHDLRAPLRGVASLAQWIEEDLEAHDALRDETREMLHLMKNRTHRMEGLIEGLLQYSRAGRASRAAEPVDTGALAREVVDLLAPPEGAHIEIAGDLPTLVTERLPLQQVLMNLLGNAVKHGGGRSAHVRLSSRADGDFQEFAVQDHGPGIAPEFHERIWGVFQTLEARDDLEATGIGLALVRKIVEAAGGRAWVESRPGEGATFRFLWPRRTA